MARRKSQRGKSHDIDTILRHTSRRHPTALPRVLIDLDEPIERFEWVETQVTARQRRIDRGLLIEASGELRLLHIEWTLRLNRAVRRRIHEYHHLLVMAFEMDVRAKHKNGQPRPKSIPIDSVVVVLMGPKRGMPRFSSYRTSSPNEKLSGVQFRIEPIYQRTVAEMEAMGDDFWLVFVPLAVDVTIKKLEQVINALRLRTNHEDFDDLVATMVVLARLNKNHAGLPDMIESLVPKEGAMFDLHPFYQRGKQKGLEKGLEKGLQETRVRLLEKRLTRGLTSGERSRVSTRIVKHGYDLVDNAILDLSRDELAAWLAPNGHRSPER